MNQRTHDLAANYRCLIESVPPKFSSQVQNPAIKSIREFVISDPAQYHGQSFVSSKLQNHSNITRWIAVSANLINVLTAIPALYFGFAILGLFGLGLTGVLSGLALKFSNDNAAAAAASAKGNRLWSNQSLMTFASINILLTLLSGIGSELLTNRLGLSMQLAQMLTETHLAQSEPHAPDMSRYIKAETECQALLQKVDQLPPAASNRDELLIRAKGQYSDWNHDWTTVVDRSQIPPCWLKDMRDSDPNWVNYQQQRKRWQQLSTRRYQLGNDLQFLQQQFPQLYSKHFSQDSMILSGPEEFTVAFQAFWERLLSLNLQHMGQLGFSLFMFLLSVITSAGACIALVAHAYREDTQRSFDPHVREAILAHLAYLERTISDSPDRAKPPQSITSKSATNSTVVNPVSNDAPLSSTSKPMPETEAQPPSNSNPQPYSAPSRFPRYKPSIDEKA